MRKFFFVIIIFFGYMNKYASHDKYTIYFQYTKYFGSLLTFASERPSFLLVDPRGDAYLGENMYLCDRGGWVVMDWIE